MTRSEARLLAPHADSSPLTRKLQFKLALKRGGLQYRGIQIAQKLERMFLNIRMISGDFADAQTLVPLASN